MADSEVRQKFDDPATYGLAFVQARTSYEVLTGKEWPRDGRESSVPEIVRAAYQEGMRAGEIARWIPVEEKGVPTTFGEYLVIQEGYKDAIPADFIGGGFFTIRGYGYDSEIRELHGVTHWQPLPAAPEEKKP